MASGARGDAFFSQDVLLICCVDILKDVVVLKIAKDKAWKENISELVQFYFEHLFPKIIEGQL